MKSKRSNKLKKMRTRTPSGESKLRYKKKKHSVVKCANCKKPLQGISKLSSAKLRNTSKSKKTPKRIFGGNLCHKCTIREIIKKVRK